MRALQGRNEPCLSRPLRQRPQMQLRRWQAEAGLPLPPPPPAAQPPRPVVGLEIKELLRVG